MRRRRAGGAIALGAGAVVVAIGAAALLWPVGPAAEAPGAPPVARTRRQRAASGAPGAERMSFMRESARVVPRGGQAAPGADRSGERAARRRADAPAAATAGGEPAVALAWPAPPARQPGPDPAPPTRLALPGPNDGSIVGRVLDPDGEAVTRFELTIVARGEALAEPRVVASRELAHEDARFAVTGLDPRGAYGLMVQAPGFAPWILPGLRPGAARATLEVRLRPATIARGFVHEPGSGLGAEGAIVEAIDPMLRRPLGRTRTGPAGGFTIHGLPAGAVKLRARRTPDGPAADTDVVLQGADASDILSLRLPPP